MDTFKTIGLSQIKTSKSYVLIPISLLLIFGFISTSAYAQTTASDDSLLPKLFERVKNSVVQITVSNEDPRSSALGSGFMFDTSGILSQMIMWFVADPTMILMQIMLL